MRITASACIFFALLIRLLYLGLPEITEQEAYYWNFSRHLDFCYIDSPPLVGFVIRLGTVLAGISELGVRFMAPICWVITAVFSYCLAYRVFGRSAAIGTVLLLSSLPFYFGTAMIMTPDALLLSCWSALLFLLYRILVEGKSDWGMAGVVFGVGILSDYSMLLLIPPVVCFMLLDSKARRFFVTSGPYYCLFVALVISLPVIYWNFQNDWASLAFTIKFWSTGRGSFYTLNLLGYLLLLLTPAGVAGVLYFLFYGNSFFNNRISLKLEGGNRLNRSYLFLLLTMILPLTAAFSFSFVKEVKLNLTASFWLSVMPFLGCTVMSIYEKSHSGFFKLMQLSWKITISMLLLLYIVFLHHVVMGIPGVTYPIKPFLLGWEKFAAELETIVETSEEQNGTRPVVVGMNPYQISSGIAFYRAKINARRSAKKMKEVLGETIGVACIWVGFIDVPLLD